MYATWLEINLQKKRYLIKFSGEILKNSNQSGIDWEAVDNICKKLALIIKTGIQLGFVVGGGNIFRGAFGKIKDYDRIIGDQIGMMATVVNSLAFIDRLRANGVFAILQSGIKIEGVADLFNKDRVEEVFNKGGAVVFCGGTGNPYFSTDTTSVLRALQIGANYVFKATKVDGIYDKDPNVFPDAKMYNSISFDKIIEKRLKIMDLTSILLMKENKMKLMVFNMLKGSLLEKACVGEAVGTVVEG